MYNLIEEQVVHILELVRLEHHEARLSSEGADKTMVPIESTRTSAAYDATSFHAQHNNKLPYNNSW